MGDFLSNLVAKNLNRAPVLEPRPLSLYEPWRRSGAGEFASGNDVAAFEVSTSREAVTPSPRLQAAEPIQSSHREPIPNPPNLRPDNLRIPFRSADTIEVNSRVTREITPLAEAPPVRESRPLTAKVETDSNVASLQPRVEGTLLTDMHRVEVAIVEKEEPKSSFAPAAREQLAPKLTLTPSQIFPTEPASKEPNTKPRDLHAPAPPTLLPRSVPSFRCEEPTQSAPETINVTIGRIEVRALTSRPAPKTPRVPAPSTLDDYL